MFYDIGRILPDGVDRIVAIGDVHGSYDKFLALLRDTGLVDEGSSWTGGTSHLVLVGDLVDRGRDDRKVMDLVMRLQTEAKAAGGEVHALLGNHDLMVLMRDLRYVEKKSYAAFAPDENPEDRAKGWAGYVTAYPADRAGDPKLRAAFDDSYPPGFFAYLRMLDLEGPYGAWALARPAVIKVNGIVFVHGGLTGKVAAKGLEGINREIHEAIVAYAKAAKALEPLIKGPATFEEISAVAYDIDKGAFKGKKLVIDSEMAQIIARMAQGIEVNEDTLALDVIHKVGVGKDYLGQRHTLNHFKTEHFIPVVSDRTSYDRWLSKGTKTIVDRAGDEVRRIFKEHSVEPVPNEVAEVASKLVKKRTKR